jgi:hypothetical protein
LIKGEVDSKWRQRKEDIVEYSDFLKDFVGDALESDQESEFDSDLEDVEDQIDNAPEAMELDVGRVEDI